MTAQHGRPMNRGGAAVRAAGLFATTILLIIGLGTHQPLRAQPADVRAVTMRAAPDGGYRAQPNWEARLRTTVAAVSAIYEKTFQIRFVILDIVPWAAGPSGDPVRQISKLMADVPVGRADIVVAFGTRCEGLKSGWTWVLDRFAMVTSGCDETAALKDPARGQAILSHELAHLFGAFHPASPADSVMSTHAIVGTITFGISRRSGNERTSATEIGGFGFVVKT